MIVRDDFGHRLFFYLKLSDVTESTRARVMNFSAGATTVAYPNDPPKCKCGTFYKCVVCRYSIGAINRDNLDQGGCCPIIRGKTNVTDVLRVIGANPQATLDGKQRKPLHPIATIFPQWRTYVGVEGVHASQRQRMLEYLEQRQHLHGEEPWTREQRDEVRYELLTKSVDLFVDSNYIWIRPDPSNLPLAFEADDQLQCVVPKWRIRFLNVQQKAVHDAIRQRGELWRIAPPAKSIEEMIKAIDDSRARITGDPLYYYCSTTGTRWLTCQKLNDIAAKDDTNFTKQLLEILWYCRRRNRINYPEVDFFLDGGKLHRRLAEVDFRSLLDDSVDIGDENEWKEKHLGDPDTSVMFDARQFDVARLRGLYDELITLFRENVQQPFCEDDSANAAWRWRMYSTIANVDADSVSEEQYLKLAPEFFMHVQWLAGAQIDDEVIVYDPIFEESECEQRSRVCDEKVKGFIANLARENDLQHVNVGRIDQSLGSREITTTERREVYLVCYKTTDQPEEIMRILRLQKWGVREHLLAGDDLLQAIRKSDEYTEYCLNRRLGAWRLGMKLSRNVIVRRIVEDFSFPERGIHDLRFHTTYFDRDYVRGLATDKIPDMLYQSPGFAIRVAEFLGAAAASNLIVGRCDRPRIGKDGELIPRKILFDDGDEILSFKDGLVPTELTDGKVPLPQALIIADPTASFQDFKTPLIEMIEDYAAPVVSRNGIVPDIVAFSRAYWNTFCEKFNTLQRKYRFRPQRFHSLFTGQPNDGIGNFRYRWECVLRRLDKASLHDLSTLLSEKINEGLK